MRINIKVLGGLKKYVNFGGLQELDIDESMTGIELVRMLGFPDGLSYVYLLNGKRESLDNGLKEGDEVAIFPVVTGG